MLMSAIERNEHDARHDTKWRQHTHGDKQGLTDHTKDCLHDGTVLRFLATWNTIKILKIFR